MVTTATRRTASCGASSGCARTSPSAARSRITRVICWAYGRAASTAWRARLMRLAAISSNDRVICCIDLTLRTRRRRIRRSPAPGMSWLSFLCQSWRVVGLGLVVPAGERVEVLGGLRLLRLGLRRHLEGGTELLDGRLQRLDALVGERALGAQAVHQVAVAAG